MVSAGQIRAARGLIGINQRDLARLAGVGISAVVRVEKSPHRVQVRTLEQLIGALERVGVVFANGSVALASEQKVSVPILERVA